MKLGLNGLGRIGKLTLWQNISQRYFGEIVVNVGRKVGSGIHDLAHYVERDSTYGYLHGFLHGHHARSVISEVNEAEQTMLLDGIKVKFLDQARNPKDIDWAGQGVRLVVDATGQFLDPTLPVDARGGSCLGHLEAGADKVIVSAPFKIKDKGKAMPPYALTTVMGVNHHDYDPKKHTVVSNASCTTTCLAHMIKPLLDNFGVKKILTASMATVHAVTGSQAVLDKVPAAGATDLRKSRSIFNNIILTSTGAAKALVLVIPEMGQIGFIAESVRIPTASGSLIILVVNLQDEGEGGVIRRETINGIYRQAAENDPDGYLLYSEEQNVSRDIVGMPQVGAVIEAHETHTRTADISIDLEAMGACQIAVSDTIENKTLKVPVTQAVIYGWYDNEFASYVYMLGQRTASVADLM
ncbi:MAG: glyceraldehyde-3-phosphate dehydrogenase [Deltaproteobacteria bacterium]|nr:glyceraldehyde-3-phosphate dehydrogenase [Deltaproteobacteria bacterium]